MPKLTLTQNPTFTAKVLIPIPGASAVPVEFTFRNRTRDAFSKWMKELDGKDKEIAVCEMALGWDLEDEFNEENVTKLLANYLGAFEPIMETYMRELTQAKEKN